VGTYYELDQLVELLLRDKVYYEVSGGGVTLSGGEPTFYIDYVSQLLRKLSEQGIHSTIETAGCFGYETFQSRILPFLSLVLYDIKLADPEEHRVYTGLGNRVILDNFRRLIEDSPIPVIPRIPLIPGITATPENLQPISEFIQECGLTQCWLLPYNPLGLSKRENLGKEPVDIAQKWMSDEEETRCRDIFSWAEPISI
jgi:pyruvate formate lyase activating enzyme